MVEADGQQYGAVCAPFRHFRQPSLHAPSPFVVGKSIVKEGLVVSTCEMMRPDPGPVRRLPPEGSLCGVEAAPDHGRIDPARLQQHGDGLGVPERIGKVACKPGHPHLPGCFDADQKVSGQAFAGHQELVGQYIPGAEEHLLLFHEPADMASIARFC